MTQPDLRTMRTDDLVSRFTDTALAQDGAIHKGNLGKLNRLILQMRDIQEELKSRPGDQRRALMSLYGHPNMQVRLMAAKATLAVAPEEARSRLQAIASSKWYPQAGDAGMCLRGLDDGTFRPK